MSNAMAYVSSAPLLTAPLFKSRASRLSSQSSYLFKGRPLARTPVLFPSIVVKDDLFQLKRKHGFCSVHAKDVNAGQWDNERQWPSQQASVLLTVIVERLPKPVMDFPWSIVVGHFIHTVFSLAVAVVKYLCVPVLALSSLSEMSYCAHERKMFCIPIPFLTGVAIAAILKQTAVDLAPDVLEQKYPWHLLLMALFFVILKLPGPYYPYLGRLIIPHFANGGLWGTLWFIFHWYRVDRK